MTAPDPFRRILIVGDPADPNALTDSLNEALTEHGGPMATAARLVRVEGDPLGEQAAHIWAGGGRQEEMHPAGGVTAITADEVLIRRPVLLITCDNPRRRNPLARAVVTQAKRQGIEIREVDRRG